MPLCGRTVKGNDISSWWLPWSSLEALKFVFNASEDGRVSHPGGLSVSVSVSLCILFTLYSVLLTFYHFYLWYHVCIYSYHSPYIHYLSSMCFNCHCILPLITVRSLIQDASNPKTWTYWSQVLSQEWRCSLSRADRRCSNYIWVMNKLPAKMRVILDI